MDQVTDLMITVSAYVSLVLSLYFMTYKFAECVIREGELIYQGVSPL